MRLSELKTGEHGVIVRVLGRGAFRKRIIEMGFIKGKRVDVIKNAPLKDPIHYKIMNYNVSLRRKDAELIEVVSISEYVSTPTVTDSGNVEIDESSVLEELKKVANERRKTIHVALIGNPNCGKTSLFNYACGLNEHIGNYSGVTVEAKEGTMHYAGYTFKIIDLPGTYSLSAYTPEELYIRKYLSESTQPDVVINIVDSSNLERNLYLTTQLIDMDVQTVIALNMYDELESSGASLNYKKLSGMVGTPMVPTIFRKGIGVNELFDRVIKVYENQDKVVRHIHINYGNTLEQEINTVSSSIKANLPEYGKGIAKRYLAIKLLEGDPKISNEIFNHTNGKRIKAIVKRSRERLESFLKEDPETTFTDARYGFISGALAETLKVPIEKKKTKTQRIDHFLTHRYLGFPLFLLFIFIMFECTFYFGQYPMDWIEEGVMILSNLLEDLIPEGSFKDLLLNGIIGGVGGVIVFLPNILILYFFISIMEDTGYMARAAFIMDKLMHRMGLHGKSFIPLIMGFGCTVPSIMASRTIESRNSRMITMLINPLISCSARLPVYLLLAGAFFPDKAGIILFFLYLLGIILAVIMGRIFKRFIFSKEEIPFVMELPPYRIPTTRSVFTHMWEKARQYLRKMGGVILLASIVIWFLGYFPQATLTEEEAQQIELIKTNEKLSEETRQYQLLALEHQIDSRQQANSYIGRIGKTIEPIIAPLGFDWKIGISLISGMAAKEIVVSTLGVIYPNKTIGHEDPLPERLKKATDDEGNLSFTPLLSLTLMVFVLIYFPCIATIVAISKESGSWKWGVFVIFYTCLLAWIVAFLVKTIGRFF